ncbi:MAG: hypothetical protein PW792_00535 [Acidobacteriaceae bacterium]|nr:hypothetical protein [Acidobacteriaceae bacterium]
MHLWTEYEGKTVNGDYTLGRLLRSEGRNGFFATADKKGQQAVIRLTEAHFDEDQQLARWRQVSVLKQPHLIGIDNVGRADLDGVSLTFALMESDDANLEEVLKERPLTTAEALQVARAVTEALQSLHASGLVHEHIEPANVMAVGEVVKLRSDCVRECVADGEFRTQEGCAELRRKDVNALAVLLLRCLTLDSEIRPGAPLPEPFYRILPGALAGTLSLDQISAILGPSDEAKAKAEALAAERAASAKAAQEEAQIIAEKTAEPVVAKPTVASAPAPKAATPVPAAAAVRNTGSRGALTGYAAELPPAQ